MKPDSLSFLTLITKLRVMPHFAVAFGILKNTPANFETKSKIRDEFQISK